MESNLDYIELKVRGTHCATKDPSGACTACENGYEFVIDALSGRENCLPTATPVTCPTGSVFEVSSSSCILPSECSVAAG